MSTALETFNDDTYYRNEDDSPILVDEASGATTYLGYCFKTPVTNKPIWKIKRIIKSGTVTTTMWADGDKLYNNIWDNRASLVYNYCA
jgi:hypothetical protein